MHFIRRCDDLFRSPHSQLNIFYAHIKQHTNRQVQMQITNGNIALLHIRLVQKSKDDNPKKCQLNLEQFRHGISFKAQNSLSYSKC